MIFNDSNDSCNFRYGRKLPLVVAIITQVIAGTLCAYVPWFLGLLVFKFITAFATGGTMILSFVLCMELIGKFTSYIF